VSEPCKNGLNRSRCRLVGWLTWMWAKGIMY